MGLACIFNFLRGTECGEKKPLSETTGVAQKSIISASKVYEDTLPAELETQAARNENFYMYRSACIGPIGIFQKPTTPSKRKRRTE